MKKLAKHHVKAVKLTEDSVILLCENEVKVEIETPPSKTKIVLQSQNESVNISDIHNGNIELSIHMDTYKMISDFFSGRCH